MSIQARTTLTIAPLGLDVIEVTLPRQSSGLPVNTGRAKKSIAYLTGKFRMGLPKPVLFGL